MWKLRNSRNDNFANKSSSLPDSGDRKRRETKLLLFNEGDHFFKHTSPQVQSSKDPQVFCNFCKSSRPPDSNYSFHNFGWPFLSDVWLLKSVMFPPFEALDFRTRWFSWSFFSAALVASLLEGYIWTIPWNGNPGGCWFGDLFFRNYPFSKKMELENYPKWKETTIWRDPCFHFHDLWEEG